MTRHDPAELTYAPLSQPDTPTFLTAQWRYLAMLNYEVDPAVLRPLVPAGTELDEWSGCTYVSMVGFLFLETVVRGMRIPYHRNFEEVNLRFYVRRSTPEGWRRGVVFVKELVPRWAIAFTARVVYGENYASVPMGHEIINTPGDGTALQSVAYWWRYRGETNRISVTVQGAPEPIAAGSEAEFITEHYWGYARNRRGRTLEYQVAHPRWNAWRASDAQFTCNVGAVYGPQFEPFLSQPSRSAFLADGSPIAVHRGRPI
jgi:uncharacterized protein YqjF (DUF2071 family)